MGRMDEPGRKMAPVPLVESIERRIFLRYDKRTGWRDLRGRNGGCRQAYRVCILTLRICSVLKG